MVEIARAEAQEIWNPEAGCNMGADSLQRRAKGSSAIQKCERGDVAGGVPGFKESAQGFGQIERGDLLAGVALGIKLDALLTHTDRPGRKLALGGELL